MRHTLNAVVATAMMVLATILSASCSKAEEPFNQSNVETYGLNLRFDAEGVTQATLRFYDDDLVQVGSDVVDIPANSNEIVTTSFVSDSRPGWVYTDGLVNGDTETGMIRLTGRSVVTKAGGEMDAVLLIIRE